LRGGDGTQKASVQRSLYGLILVESVSALPAYLLFLTPKPCPWIGNHLPPPERLEFGFVILCVCQPPLFLHFIVSYSILSLRLLLILLFFFFNFFSRGSVILPSCSTLFLLVLNCSLQFDLVASLKGRLYYVRKLTLVADPASSSPQEPPPAGTAKGCRGVARNILVVARRAITRTVTLNMEVVCPSETSGLAKVNISKDQHHLNNSREKQNVKIARFFCLVVCRCKFAKKFRHDVTQFIVRLQSVYLVVLRLTLPQLQTVAHRES
jgi:hypothetical protein